MRPSLAKLLMGYFRNSTSVVLGNSHRCLAGVHRDMSDRYRHFPTTEQVLIANAPPAMEGVVDERSGENSLNKPRSRGLFTNPSCYI